MSVRCVSSSCVTRRDALCKCFLSLVFPCSILRSNDGTGGLAITVSSSPLILAQQAMADEPSTFRYRYQSVETLGSFQRADMRADYQKRAQNTIRQFLDSSDAPSSLRLAMLDAGTYDAASKTGGICGAIILRQAHG